MLLSQSLNLFLKDQLVCGSTPKTIRHYRTHVQYFINFTGDIEVDKINYDLYQDYVIYLKTKYKSSQGFENKQIYLAGRTIKTYVSALKTFLSYCHSKLRVLSNDISKDIKMPKYQKKVIQILNYEQIKSIISHYDTSTYLGCRNLLSIALMLDCGLRVSEVANLCYLDFDVVSRCIRVNGKGQKQRFVPFTDFVLNTYNKLLLLNNFDYPFCDIQGNRLKVEGIVQIVKRLKKDLGYENLHPHLLRHTFATLYLLNGGDPLTLQLILGHTTLFMTENYVHLANQLIINQKMKFTPLSQNNFIS